MGGLTGFSSLIDGYMRLDPSGIGAPSTSALEQPETDLDRMYAKAANVYLPAKMNKVAINETKSKSKLEYKRPPSKERKPKFK